MSADNGFSTGPKPFAQQAEALIRTLTGVLMARVVTDEHDRIHEIHALVDDSRAPGQFARNIQSALLARFGALVELEHIYVSSTPAGLRNGKHGHGVDAARPFEERTYEATVSDAATHGRRLPAPDPAAGPATAPAVATLEIERGRTHRVNCRLSIQWDDASFVGTAEVVDGPGARAEVAARATIAALNRTGRTPPLALEGVRTTEIAGRMYATVAVRAHLGRSIRYLAGAAAIDHSAEDAAADATLQAAAPCFTTAQPGSRASLAAAS